MSMIPASDLLRRAICLDSRVVVPIRDIRDGVCISEVAVLSYVWGASSEQDNPFWPGHQTCISINQDWDAILGHIAQVKRDCSFTGIKYVWIDAICIDQLDDQDVTWHITRMRDIYKLCGLCLVKTSLDVPAQDVDKMLGDFKASLRLDGLDSMIRRCHDMPPTADSRNLLLVTALSEDSRQIFVSIAQDPWFNRVWTLQEGVLPAIDRVVWLINDTTFRDFHMVCSILFESVNLGAEVPENENSEMIVALGKLARVLNIRNRRRVRDNGLTLGDAFEYARRRLSTVPADRLVGVLGLTVSRDFVLPENYKGMDLQHVFETVEGCALAHGDVDTVMFYGNASLSRSYSPDVSVPGELPKWSMSYLYSDCDTWTAIIDTEEQQICSTICCDIEVKSPVIRLPPHNDTGFLARGLMFLHYIGGSTDWDKDAIVYALPLDDRGVKHVIDAVVDCLQFVFLKLAGVYKISFGPEHFENCCSILDNLKDSGSPTTSSFWRTLVGRVTGRRSVNVYGDVIVVMKIHGWIGYGLFADASVDLSSAKAIWIRTRLVRGIYRSEWLICKEFDGAFKKVGIAFTGCRENQPNFSGTFRIM